MIVSEMIEALMALDPNSRLLMIIHELDDTEAYEVVEVVAAYKKENDVHFLETDAVDSFVSAGETEIVAVIR